MDYEVGTHAAMTHNWSTLSYGPLGMSPHLLADMQTTNGGDTSNLRYRNRTSSGVEIRVAEEQSHDAEVRHSVADDVGYFALVTSAPPIAFAMEVGEVSIDHNWETVNLSGNFTDPVVVAKPLGSNDVDPCVVRIRNVSAASFDIRVQEWDYLDDVHANETVSWLAMERGHWTLDGGAQVQAGDVTTGSCGAASFAGVTFSQAVGTAPVMMTSVTTINEIDAVATRNRNVTTTGFDVTMQEQQSNTQSHASETISYIAWEPGTGTQQGIDYEVGTHAGVTHNWSSLSYGPFGTPPYLLADMQTTNGGDTSNMRYRNRTSSGVEIRVAEEQSHDAEVRHSVADDIGYFAFQ
jgi:hypothetical protein